MDAQRGLDGADPGNRGLRARLWEDFKVHWIWVLAGSLPCWAIAGLAGALSLAAFRGGYQGYAFNYLAVAMVIAFVFPALLFLMMRGRW